MKKKAHENVIANLLVLRFEIKVEKFLKMKNHVDEDGFELIDHKDAAERSSHHVLSKRLSEEEGGEDINNLAHWNDKGRKKWTVLLFFGCLLVYATRTSVSICAVHMGKELGWDKELSVSHDIYEF